MAQIETFGGDFGEMCFFGRDFSFSEVLAENRVFFKRLHEVKLAGSVVASDGLEPVQEGTGTESLVGAGEQNLGMSWMILGVGGVL